MAKYHQHFQSSGFRFGSYFGIRTNINKHLPNFANCFLLSIFLLVSRFGRIYSTRLFDEQILQFLGIGCDYLFINVLYLLLLPCHRLLSLLSAFLMSLLIFIDIVSYQLLGAPVNLSALSLLLDHFSILLMNITMLQPIPAILLTIGILSIPVSFIIVNVKSEKLIRLFNLVSRRNKAILILSLIACCYCLMFFGQFPRANAITRLTLSLLGSLNPYKIDVDKFVGNELKYLYDKQDRIVKYFTGLSDREAPKTSLFVILLESVRASSLPVYNSKIPRELTPFLSSLIESGEGYKVNNLHSSMPNTMKTLYAAMCGVLPHPSVQWYEYDKHSPYLEYCLPNLLGKVGYDTRFYTSSTVGFQERLGFDKCFSGRDLDVIHKLSHVKRSFNNGKRMQKRRIMLSDQTWDIKRRRRLNGKEEVYGRISRLGFDERIMNQPVADWLTEQHNTDNHKPCFGVFGALTTHAPYVTYNQTRKRLVKSLVEKIAIKTPSPSNYEAYLSAIHDTDDWLKSMVEDVLLPSEQMKDGGVIVIVGDHGEGFGDHIGESFHGGGIYEETIHIPMIVIDKRLPEAELTGSKSSTWSRATSYMKSRVFGSIDLFETFLGFLNINQVNVMDIVRPNTLPPSTNMLKPSIRGQSENGKSESIPCEAVAFSLMDDNNAACLSTLKTSQDEEGTILKLLLGGEKQRFKTDLFNLKLDDKEMKGKHVDPDTSFFSFSSASNTNYMSPIMPDSSELVGSAKWIKKAKQYVKHQKEITSLRYETKTFSIEGGSIKQHREVGVGEVACSDSSQECCFVHISGRCSAYPKLKGLGWFEDPLKPSHSMTDAHCLTRKVYWESVCGDVHAVISTKVGYTTEMLSKKETKEEKGKVEEHKRKKHLLRQNIKASEKKH